MSMTPCRGRSFMLGDGQPFLLMEAMRAQPLSCP
jgi:hypothetical protein